MEWWKLPSSQLHVTSLQCNDRIQFRHTQGILTFIFHIVPLSITKGHHETRNLCRFKIPMLNSTRNDWQVISLKIILKDSTGLLPQLPHLHAMCVHRTKSHIRDVQLKEMPVCIKSISLVISFRSTQHLLNAFSSRTFPPRTYPVARITRCLCTFFSTTQCLADAL